MMKKPKIIKKNYVKLSFWRKKLLGFDRFFAIYHPLKNEIWISNDISKEIYPKVLQHELNHWKQLPYVKYSYIFRAYVLTALFIVILPYSIYIMNKGKMFGGWLLFSFFLFVFLYRLAEDYLVHRNNPITKELQDLRKKK